MNYRELQVFRQNEIDVRVGGTVLAWRYAYAQMVYVHTAIEKTTFMWGMIFRNTLIL